VSHILLDPLYLRQCIESGNFAIFRQNIYAIDGVTPMGTELLLRISSQSNEEGTAQAWIELAEKSDLVGPLTLKIVEKLIENAHEIHPQWAPYFINITPPVMTKDFVQNVEKLLKNSPISFHDIGFEFTERQSIPCIHVFQEAIEELKKLGVITALDDYGCGFSTMSFLKNAHVDRVKIDQSLLQKAQNNKDIHFLLESLMSFAQDFNMDVIAEGVETQADFEYAQSLGCDGVQGFYLKRPELFMSPSGHHAATTQIIKSHSS
jgi:EAL domain-containing protein (putative c-di-GMP-specific phosphodiesterase class I)